MERLAAKLRLVKKNFRPSSVKFEKGSETSVITFMAKKIFRAHHLKRALACLRDFSRTGTVARTEWNPAEGEYEFAFYQKPGERRGGGLVWKMKISGKGARLSGPTKLSDLHYAILWTFLHDLHESMRIRKRSWK